MKKQIEEIDKLVLPDFLEHLSFKFCYLEALNPENYAEQLVDSIKDKEED